MIKNTYFCNIEIKITYFYNTSLTSPSTKLRFGSSLRGDLVHEGWNRATFLRQGRTVRGDLEAQAAHEEQRHTAKHFLGELGRLQQAAQWAVQISVTCQRGSLTLTKIRNGEAIPGLEVISKYQLKQGNDAMQRPLVWLYMGPFFSNVRFSATTQSLHGKNGDEGLFVDTLQWETEIDFNYSSYIQSQSPMGLWRCLQRSLFLKDSLSAFVFPWGNLLPRFDNPWLYLQVVENEDDAIHQEEYEAKGSWLDLTYTNIHPIKNKSSHPAIPNHFWGHAWSIKLMIDFFTPLQKTYTVITLHAPCCDVPKRVRHQGILFYQSIDTLEAWVVNYWLINGW